MIAKTTIGIIFATVALFTSHAFAANHPRCTVNPFNENLELHGLQRCVYPDGTEVVTMWQRGKKHGKQIWKCKNGETVELDWQFDDPSFSLIEQGIRSALKTDIC